MRAIEENEELGFILSRKRGQMLRRDSLIRLRQSLNDLFHLGVLTQKEKAYIEFETDKIIYKEKLKGGKTK